MNPGGNGGLGGPDSPMKISANFIHFYPLKKSNFSPVWHALVSLDIDPVYSRLSPRITSTRSTSKFRFNTFQYSVGGDVMTDAMIYGQDCTTLRL